MTSEGLKTMEHKQFQEWLSGGSAVAAIEARVGEDRRCPHCSTAGAISRGKTRGLASLPVQGVWENLQYCNRHGFVWSSPQGQVTCLCKAVLQMG